MAGSPAIKRKRVRLHEPDRVTLTVTPSDPLTQANNPLADLSTISACVDTVGFFSVRPLPDHLFERFKEMGARFDSPTRWGFTFRVHHCNRQMLAEFDRILQERRGLKVSRVDIAFDLHFVVDHHRDCAARYLRQHLFIRRGARGVRKLDSEEYCKFPIAGLTDDDPKLPMSTTATEGGDHFYNHKAVGKDGTVSVKLPTGNFYYVDHRGRRSPARNYLVYKPDHKPSNVLRLEIRLFHAQTIKRYFPHTLESIRDEDPHKIFHRHFCLRFFKPKYIEKCAKNEVAKVERDILLGRRRHTLRRYPPQVGILERWLRYTPDRVIKHTVIEPLVLSVPIKWAS